MASDVIQTPVVHISVNLPRRQVEKIDEMIRSRQKNNVKFTRSDMIREIISSVIEPQNTEIV